MSVSQDVLDHPLDWRDQKLWPLLDDLQGNILKGHGRDHTLNHFLAFDHDRAEDVRSQLKALGFQITSALRQLNEADAFRMFQRPGGTAVFMMLSAGGYAKLGLAPPAGEAFAAGMDARDLGDPPAPQWQRHLRPGADALLIVADDSATKVGNAAAALTSSFAANGIRLLGMDAGHALRSEASEHEPKGRGVEHFGYVDGRSQPLMLAEDVNRERTQQDGIDVWNPSTGPGRAVLVSDPHGAGADSYGSFLVYRKLEQNVKAFKMAERELARALGLKDEDEERAGAMVVGRFEDGTPLIASPKANDPNPTPNNFDYEADPHGLKCPIHAHIRKINPRKPADDEQRSHLMPRRGIPFGDPDRDLEDEASFPTEGVGLLFMAYNQELENQFEVTQRLWANEPGFPAGTGTGIDPIIGQTAGSKQRWNPGYGVEVQKVDGSFGGYVTMRGGGYFFAPSRSFFKAL